jgi:hypothetical protein
MARLVLGSVYVRSGKHDLSARVVEDVHRAEPTFSLAKFEKGQPYRDLKLLEQFISDLTKAGLAP